MTRLIATANGVGFLQVRLVVPGYESPWRTVSGEKFSRTPFGKDPHSNVKLEGRLLTLSGRVFSTDEGVRA